MHPVQIFYMVSLFVILALAWLGGGHTERAGVAMYVPLQISATAIQKLHIGDLLTGEFIIDCLWLLGLTWLAFKGNRWWPLVAMGFQTLVMFIYLATAVVPEFSLRTGILATWALAVILLYCLLGGVLERILAGETPVSKTAIWTRVRRPPAAPTT